MSVYKPAKSPFFQYDFQAKGRRFHGSTGVETRRAAEEIERRIRREVALDPTSDGLGAMTLDQAVGRWWVEVGLQLRGAADRQRQVTQLLALIGPNTPITEITTARISLAIELRRGQTFRRSAQRGAAEYRPSNTTVNRDVIDALRPVLNRARKTWEVKGLPEIDWHALRLAEPKAKALEFTEAELDAIVASARPHWADFIRFMALYGCRLGEMFFGLEDLDVADRDDARVCLRDRKGDDDHTIPLMAADAAMLAARAGRAREAGLDTVWFRQVGRQSKRTSRPPKLQALTYAGAKTALRRAMATTGLRATKGARGAHGLRHHGAMKILRATGNLRAAQRLLGHASIHSTLVYAHAVEEDIRAGLAAVAAQAAPPAAGAAAADQVARSFDRLKDATK